MCTGTRGKKTLGREGIGRETTYQKPEARKQEALLLCKWYHRWCWVKAAFAFVTPWILF